MKPLLDALENCIVELQTGETVEAVLGHYPELAESLRPLLEAAVAARQLGGVGPSAREAASSRSKIMRAATEVADRGNIWQRSSRSSLRRLASAAALSVVFLTGGTGIVYASSGALPGENLYFVKRSWEGLRLLLVMDARRALALRGEFENERLGEVGQLLELGRHEKISFAGVYLDVEGRQYVSGLPVTITAEITPAASSIHNGAAVMATGHTDASGEIRLDSLELLPSGAVVPVGQPVPAGIASQGGEAHPEQDGASGQPGLPVNEELGVPQVRFQIEGVVNSIDADVWLVDGRHVYVAGAAIRGAIQVGSQVEVEGYFDQDARFIAVRIELDDSGEPEAGRAESDAGNGGGTDDDSNGNEEAESEDGDGADPKEGESEPDGD